MPPASLELARQLGSAKPPARIFKNEFGRSMLQYVRDRRFEIGRQMVREGRWQIAQIAYRLGYQSGKLHPCLPRALRPSAGARVRRTRFRANAGRPARKAARRFLAPE